MSSSPSLGQYLRDARRRSGVALEDIARTTRIPVRFLEGLESEQLDAMPAPVFIRGFIRAYCEAVGAAPDEALALYRPSSTPELPPDRPASRARVRGHAGPRSRGPVLVSLSLVGVLGVAFLVVTVLLQPARDAGRPTAMPRGRGPEVTSSSAPPPTTSAGPVGAESPPAGVGAASPDSAADAASATPPGPTPAPPRDPASPSALPRPADTPPSPGADTATASRTGQNGPVVGAITSPYRLVARATEPTWVRVRMEDGRATEETIPAGETREWVSNAPFVLTVGNAGGVTLELNGEKLAPLGGRGVVVPRLVIPPPPRP